MENMLLNIHLSHTEKPVSPIYNSVLFLEPDWNIYEQNYEQHIAVKIATGGEAINAVKVTLNYDPSAVKVLDLLMNQSFCNKQFILEKVIDNNKGQVVLACGLPASGFSDHFATVTELLVKPLKAGSFNLRFGEGKSVLVLANDGLGTNVLRRTTNGSYRVSVAPTKTGSVATSSPSRTNANSDQAKKESEKLPLILVSSLTHPNSERWFSSRDIYFNWLHTSDEHYVYLFNQQPDSTLIDGKHMSRNSIKVTAWTDGVYYFHLATENNGVIGPVSHYKVMIDSAPPESLNIKASQTKIKTGEIVRFKLEGNDKMSGLQPTFYLKVDEETFLPVPSDPVISFDSSGKHIITARVFDNAGNIKNTSVEIKVEARSTFERSMTAISGWLMHLYSRTKLLT
jgi:proteasome lid subunit RPN8/RPN11